MQNGDAIISGSRRVEDHNQYCCMVYSVCCLKFSWFTVLGTVWPQNEDAIISSWNWEKTCSRSKSTLLHGLQCLLPSIPGLQCWELSDRKMKMRSSAAEIGRRHAADHIISVAWFTVCAALNFPGLQCWELSDRKMKMRSSAAEIGRRHATQAIIYIS
jgi:hypothetical protein